MTNKEISELCKVDLRTVQLWAKKVGEKISSIGEKISSSTSTYPADFTLPETIAIIRAGGNDTLADLLAQNANEKKSPAIPNGKQLEQLRLMMMAGGDTARMAMMFTGLEPRPAYQPISRQALAVQRQVEAKEEAKAVQDLLNLKLGFDK